MTQENIVVLDLLQVRKTADVGVRRAAAFLGIGLKAVADGPPKSVLLSGLFNAVFLPEPLPDELRPKVSEEYSAWLVACGLRELDLHFSMFLDNVDRAMQIAADGPRVKQKFSHDAKFSQDTNVARKYETLMARLGRPPKASEMFSSLSKTRNALAHAAGYVRPRDVNAENGLEIRWLAFDIVAVEGAKETVLNGLDTFETSHPDGAQIVVRTTERTRVFGVGMPVRLDPRELTELCLFYHSQTGEVMRALEEWLSAKGIESVEPSTRNGRTVADPPA